jgi:Golgi phosphoprotein 3 (GPP34)
MDIDEIGVDLILLTARPNGTLPHSEKLSFGLSGSELVRLVAARRVDIVKGRIVVLDMAPTGDPLLDEALVSMASGRREPTAKAWVARRRTGHVRSYQDRLANDGVIRAERYKFLGFLPAVRWEITDTARAAQARSRLEAVAASTGPVQPAQAALAGLATAIDAARPVFPGQSGRAARKRLKQAARGDFAAAGASRAAAGANARDEAYREAISDSLTSAIDSVIHAAVHAATEATHHAAHSSAHSGHSGHSGGGGGGGGGHH